MAESSDLKQKLDVISYVAAGILSLGVLALPMLRSGDASVSAEKIQQKLQPGLREEMDKADQKSAPPAPE